MVEGEVCTGRVRVRVRDEEEANHLPDKWWVGIHPCILHPAFPPPSSLLPLLLLLLTTTTTTHP